MNDLKILLSVLNDESVNINSKFKVFVNCNSDDRSKVIDIIDDSPYSRFIDIYYELGEDLCNELDYEVLLLFSKFKKTKAVKKYKNFGEFLNARLKQVMSNYIIENIVIQLAFPNKKKSKNYVGSFYRKDIIRDMFDNWGINLEDSIKIIKIFFKNDYEFKEVSSNAFNVYCKK